jgi:hypothetical protein
MIPPSAAAGCAAVGDIVLCRDERERENLKIPNELGLVLESKSDRARVYFRSVGGEPWIRHASLARVRDPEGAAVAPWMKLACAIARRLQALRLEIASLDDDACALRVFHGEVELSELSALASDLGPTLRHFSVAPSGMHRIESAIAFAPPPEPR